MATNVTPTGLQLVPKQPPLVQTPVPPAAALGQTRPALLTQQLTEPDHDQRRSLIAPYLGQRRADQDQPTAAFGRQLTAPYLAQKSPAAQAGQTTKQTEALDPQTPATVGQLNKQITPGLQTAPALTNLRSRGDRLMFSSSDDNAIMRQIQATHAPDGREILAKPLLHIVEDIFNRATPSIDAISAPGTQAQIETLAEKTIYQTNFVPMLEALAFLMERIAREIGFRCSSGEDAHTTTMSILNMLSSYSWDAKLVIALAAFAMNYGEFCLVAQTYTTNQLAKSVAILKQLPDVFEHTSTLKPRLDAVRNLIKVMLDLANCIIEFHDLPSQYITPDIPAISTAASLIPMAVYWTIRSMLACATQIVSLIGLAHEHITSSTAEAWELSTLAHKLSNMHSHLATQLSSCYKHLDEKKFLEAYQNLVHLFEMAHIDNMRVLKALIYAKDDQLPLLDGATKRRVNIDVLRRKYVLLLISDLDIPQEEISVLEQIYNESRLHPSRQESQYEVVWLPIVDPAIPWDERRQSRFEDLKATMTWYSVFHPSLIERAVIKFIREVWRFGKKPILVVLDPQGRVACPNAFHMMWIWGSLAFPFTTLREEALWREETWRLELLVDGIDPTILNWIGEGRTICLYGGEDMEWIRKFTSAARNVAQSAGILLGIAYVGKGNPKERIRRNIAAINNEKLSYSLPDPTLMWFFWTRLESMWYSKTQLGRTPENDPIVKEILAMLSFDSSEGGWAIFSRGAAEMVKAKGSTALTSLQDFGNWEKQAQEKGFIPAMRDYLMGIQPPHHCNRLILPGIAGIIPETVVCAECGRPMERFIMYQCCDE